MEEINEIKKKLESLRNEERAISTKKYLKSPYSFYGLTLPEVRTISKDYMELDFYSTLNLFDELWNSKNHEAMWLAMALLPKHVKEHPIELWKFLMPRIDKAITWDLVDDLSTHTIGKILEKRIDLISEIKEMSENKNPWIRRISIVSNLPLIKNNKIELTLRLAEKLVYDKDSYVQKGVGWMLREAGKKNRLAVRDFIVNRLDMKPFAFSYATEKMIELRELRKKKLAEIKKEEKEKIQKQKEEMKTKKKEMKKKLNEAKKD